MNRLRLIVLVLVVVLGCLFLAIFHTREPRYQGRPLTAWIEDAVSASMKYNANPHKTTRFPETDPAWQAARRAVKQMGPDAIPFLLSWVKAKDSPLTKKLNDWLNKHPSIGLQIPSAEADHFRAFFGFTLLGNDAKSAWPDLIRLTYDTNLDCRYCAFNSLAESRADKEILLPVIMRLIHDPDKNLQKYAAYTLHYYYSQDAEAAGVYKMFPQFKNRPTSQTQAK